MTDKDDWNLGKLDNDGTTPRCFIQWKGTDVCVDLYCTCGQSHHFDGYFLYAWKCPTCGKCWEMGTEVRMRETADDAPCLQTEFDDD